MKIHILNMRLLNFKGIRNLNLEFNDETTITGDNATGKTTVFDAFTWAMFGKNSSDAKDFNIKTLDELNRPIHKLDHEVEVVLQIDDKQVKLKRTLREKWVKKRGSETSEFTGHETEFFIDDVPLSQNEYKSRIDFYLREELAKMITNPLYFNQMKWSDRRTVLEGMAGEITNAEIAEGNPSFIKLLATLGDTSISDFKKKVGAQKKLLKERLEGIPTRIDEANRAMPEKVDVDSIHASITAKQTEITDVDAKIENVSKAYQNEYDLIQQDLRKLNRLKTELQQAEIKNKSSKGNKVAEIEGKISTAKREKENHTQSLESSQSIIPSYEASIEKLNAENNSLRAKWEAENAKEIVIDEHDLNCPSCKQLLPESQLLTKKETLTKNFNEAKTKALNEITETGKRNKQKIESFEAEIKAAKDRISEYTKLLTATETKLTELSNELAEVNSQDVAESAEEVQLKALIEKFMISPDPVIDYGDLKSKRTALIADLDVLKASLSSVDQANKLTTRISELEAEEKKLSQELADLEKSEFSIDGFMKAKIETIEARINGKFKLVRFKMFDQQINGGEVECCECMVKGVPYADINTASKINAGIDIINALTEHYKVNAPIFIDNRESIIKILPCKSQIINLVAMKDKKLTVTSKSLQLEEANS